MSNLIDTQKKVRISYFISDSLLSDLKDNMNKQGYDLKGKSKWITEAVHDLLKMNNYHELVMLSDQMEGFSKMDFISVDRQLKSLIDNAVIKIRTSYPALEGVQSKILRTAILQRLIKV